MQDTPEFPPGPLVVAVSGLVGDLEDWRVLSGGRTNLVWRVRAAGGDFVVKLYVAGAETPLFPNDPNAEFALLARMAQIGLSPEPLGRLHGAFGEAVIYRYVAGRAWQGNVEMLANLLNRVHGQPVPNTIRQVASGSAALLAQCSRLIAECGPHDLLAASRDNLARRAEVGAVAVSGLIHADPVGTNIIETDKSLMLIDWQCPGIGDPCEDIAIVLSPFMQRAYLGRHLTLAEAEAFLDAYPDRLVSDRYRQLAPFFHLRMAAYAAWCRAHGRDATEDDIHAEMSASEISV